MTSDYLFVFAQAHHEFRIPELLSVAEIHQITLHLPETYNISRPFMIIGLEEESHAHVLAARCILIKSAYSITATLISFF
jgi:tRNA (guanine10-N2)-methyltransferase